MTVHRVMVRVGLGLGLGSFGPWGGERLGVWRVLCGMALGWESPMWGVASGWGGDSIGVPCGSEFHQPIRAHLVKFSSSLSDVRVVRYNYWIAHTPVRFAINILSYLAASNVARVAAPMPGEIARYPLFHSCSGVYFYSIPVVSRCIPRTPPISPISFYTWGPAYARGRVATRLASDGRGTWPLRPSCGIASCVINSR